MEAKTRYLMSDGPAVLLHGSKSRTNVHIYVFDDVVLCVSRVKDSYKVEWTIDIEYLRVEERTTNVARAASRPSQHPFVSCFDSLCFCSTKAARVTHTYVQQ